MFSIPFLPKKSSFFRSELLVGNPLLILPNTFLLLLIDLCLVR